MGPGSQRERWWGPAGQREKRGRELRWAAAGLHGWAGMGRALGTGCWAAAYGHGVASSFFYFLFCFLFQKNLFQIKF